MGKTKSKSIRKSAHTLIKEGIEFEQNFERNKMAGFLVQAKKQEKKKQEMLKNK